jgi:hypothetical protein
MVLFFEKPLAMKMKDTLKKKTGISEKKFSEIPANIVPTGIELTSKV